MEIRDYQKGVLRTASTTNTADLKRWLGYMQEQGYPDPAAILMAKDGLAGEAGEVVDLLKKSVFHGHAFDKDKLVKEVGDILWYCTRMCVALGVELEDVMQGNLDKLKARYPEGFSSEASINRTE